MKLFALVVGALALLAGLAGGWSAYSAAATTPPAPHVAVVHHRVAKPVQPGVIVRWAPCRKPAVREGRACVTHVTHVVAVPAPAPAASTYAAAARAPRAAPTHSAGGWSEGEHEGGGHHHSGDD